MGAIVGIFNRNGHNVEAHQIQKMNNSLSHRGKDGSAVYCGGSIAFGHQMLYTTKESIQEKLPYHEIDSNLIITADARVDNRDELSDLLNIENIPGVPDSFFILNAYHKWGKNCPEKIIGDFAFAIWNMEKNELFCARDHMGIKPFYYYLSNNLFLFATEIKALFTNSEVQCLLNNTKIGYYLKNNYDNRKITFYKNIHRLEAAHKLTINFNNYKLEQYWKINPQNKIELINDLEYEKEFLKLFTQAVKCRLRSIYLPGALLSGGLDSSSIVCVANKLLKNEEQSLKSFSLIFEKTPESDERSFINYILEKGMINHHFINADDYSPIMKLNPILWQNDEPIRAFNLYYNYLLNCKALNENVRILLEGFGGDSTVSYGNGLLIDFLKNFNIIELYKESKSTSKRLNRNMLNIICSELIQFYYPYLKNYIPILHRSDYENKILKKEFENEINVREELQSLSNDDLKLSKSREYHYNTINTGLIQHALEENDKISGFFNIEPRYPFFDVRLMEFCFAIPTEQKRKYGWDRFILRKSMENILPEEIQWRKTKKTGLISNIKNFLDQDHKFIEDIIYDRAGPINAYVDMEIIRNTYEKFKDEGNFNDFFMIWRVVSLGLWINNKFK